MLTCNATGYPVPNIEWRQNGTSYTIRDPSVMTITPTDGLRSNSSVITVTNATTSDTGLYQCVATNEAATDIENATVIVQGYYSTFTDRFPETSYELVFPIHVHIYMAVMDVHSFKMLNFFTNSQYIMHLS